MSTHHAVERLQIDERRRPDVHAIGHDGAVAYDVIANFALGRFYRVIDFAWRRLQNFPRFSHGRPSGIILDGLQTDQPRLPHFFHADQVTIVRVSGCTDGNLEFVLIVGRVRRGFADVPFHAASPQHWPGHAKRDGVRRGQDPHALGSPDPDAALREQSFVFPDARFKTFSHPFTFLLESVVAFVL